MIVTDNIGDVTNGLKLDHSGVERKIAKGVAQVAEHAKAIIKLRTAEGKSVSGGNFKPYSKAYAIFKVREGHTSWPNLMFSGEMMGSMTHRAGGRRGRVYFGRKNEANKAMWNHKDRPFFAINPKEKRQLQRTFEEVLNER